MGVNNDLTVGWISFFIESWLVMLLSSPTYMSCRAKKFKFRVVVRQRKQKDGVRRGFEKNHSIRLNNTENFKLKTAFSQKSAYVLNILALVFTITKNLTVPTNLFCNLPKL